MKKIITILLFTIFYQMTLAGSGRPGLEYYGAQNQEATYELVSDVLIPSSKKLRTNADLLKESQLMNKFILGQMRRTPNNAAASYPKYTIEALNIAPESDTVQRVSFKLSGKGVFRIYQPAYTFFIPLNPNDIWEQSKGLCMVDKTGVEESNFWYHWEPRLPGCPLIAGVHYMAVTTKLNYLPSTELSYPEYENFHLTDGELRATYMFGLESYTTTDWNANTSSDWGAIWYRQNRDFLVQILKFKQRTWSDDEIANFLGKSKPSDGSNWPTIEDFTLDTSSGRIRFRFFLGVTGYNHESNAFHHILQDSLFNENVVFYSGHSGIGKNVDINRIEKLRGIQMPLSRTYQIYFWGGCVPYSYYTDMFFMRKQNLMDPQGTKKLDIIAYGNESIFTANDDLRLISALVDYMNTGERASYQKIIGNGDRYYLGVNGDEDNPKF